jgi:hypothetical protein
MTAATDLRSLSVQDYHRMVAAGILAADERVELPQAGWDGMEKGYEGDAIAPLAFPDCEAAVGSFCDQAIRNRKVSVE